MNKFYFSKIEELNSIEEDNNNFFKEDLKFFANDEKKEKIEINYNIEKKIEFISSKLSIENAISREKQINTKKDIFFKEKSKNDFLDNISFNKNQILKTSKKEEDKKIRFLNLNVKNEKLYRKDYYYKHFKAIFGKYLRNRANRLKNKCFPNFIYNNFSTPNYSFIGNVKLLDNYNFLFWTVKDILVFKSKKNQGNRQNNNKLLIEYILQNKNKNKDKDAYQELITFLGINLEDALCEFYENKKEFEIMSNDEDCIFYDKYFKKETGISLLEKNGFLKALQFK